MFSILFAPSPRQHHGCSVWFEPAMLIDYGKFPNGQTEIVKKESFPPPINMHPGPLGLSAVPDSRKPSRPS